ncbi:MAG TPA: sigma-70 family RNA polymerase sigma factor, partial [Propionibacteriaceae bacterium]
MTQAASTAAEAISRAAREERGRLVALLARHFGDVDLADESVQDALEEAVRTWSERGVPDNPAGWLLTVARRKAVDRLRRATSAQRRLQVAAPDLLMQATAADVESEGAPMTLDEAGIQDDQLRLILLCCHPALDPDAQVALVLRLVAGLTTSEIAAAFLVPEPTLAQRIVRAKRKIRDAKIPLVIPAAIEQRSATVLRVLYCIFNEGYLMHGPGTNAIRVYLADEAIRLTRLVVELLPNSTEAKGLLALQLFHHSRRASRVDD